MSANYIEVNKALWNKRTDVHVSSEFYDMEGFMKGKITLKQIELDLLGDIKGKSILHSQCHFGQDTISLERLGANVTGVDLSDNAIANANKIAKELNSNASFICCDIYDLPNHLDEKFDIVYTSYGTIGWLPDINRWAQVISTFLKPEGIFVFAEFHPVVWMFDNQFQKVEYRYFNSGPIIESTPGTYADPNADIQLSEINWNHGIAEVINSLIKNGLTLQSIEEFDYSPFDCFQNTIKIDEGKYRIKHLEDKIPMVYALKAKKLN